MVLLSVIGLVVAAYLLLPVKILSTISMKADVRPRLLSLEELDEDAGGYFRETAAALAGEGFAEVGYFSHPDLVPKAAAVGLLLTHMDQSTAAVVAVIDSSGRRQRHLEFACKLTDGISVHTNNGISLPTVGDNPGKVLFWCPGQADPRALWRAHQALLQNRARGCALRPLPMQQDAATFLEAEITREMQKKTARGWWRRDEAGGKYRLTLKGAYLMTWAEMPPVRQIRRARLRRASEQTRLRLDV
ncbi:MAG: hypothetical protein WD042_08260 [Phycisphaeraceae bacterium]